ncbi:MAG: hypothetical protein PHR45_01430 [Muribaculaceae bacterium]|nr:hypothetical protein [Muribaculaceae bacterium]
MKKEESEILSQMSKDPGFKVPDNYFADFADKMTKSLPERDFTPEIKTNIWHHIRPWAYMAAMFGGIWCMMNLFTLMRDNTISNDSSIAEAFRNDKFVDDFVLTTDFNEYDLIQQMYEDSVDITNDSIN